MRIKQIKMITQGTDKNRKNIIFCGGSDKRNILFRITESLTVALDGQVAQVC